MDEYYVVEEDDTDISRNKFIQKIREMLDSGWQLCGQAVITQQDKYIQVMVKFKN